MTERTEMTLFSTPLFFLKDKRAHIHIPRSIRLNGGSTFYVPVAMVDRGIGALPMMALTRADGVQS